MRLIPFRPELARRSRS